MSTTKQQHSKLIVISNTTAGVLALGLMANTMAAPGTLATSPLFLQSGAVQPNIFFMIDDSGSMDWENLPSTGARNSNAHPGPISSGNLLFTPGVHNEAMALCPGFNVMAYNPAVTYTPWWGKDNAVPGVVYANQVWPNARINPYLAGGGTTNLTNHYYMTWNDANGDGEFQDGECPVVNVAHGGVNTVGECQALGPAICVAVQDLSNAEKTNYANWYSYYRKREYVVKRALSQIISESTARAGLATINGHGDHNSLTGNASDIFSLIADIDDITTPVDAAAVTNKEGLLKSLFRINSQHGTPLRQALEKVGKYYQGTQLSWGPSPIQSAADGGECQQNFTIVMSDGQWNGGDPAVENADGDGSSAFDGGLYADGFNHTLADVAMKYYETDLSALADRVPTITGVDENNAQHMVTYTVGFGVNGTLNPDQLPGEVNFTGWPQPSANAATTIDDMRHAAFNGRGQFLSAKNPQDLITSLGKYISDIQARTGTAAAVSFNSTSLQAGTRVFQAVFNSSRWSGDLLAKDIVTDPLTGITTISSTAWKASDDIDSRIPASRQLISYDSVAKSGINFDWASLTDAQKNDLRTDGSGNIDTEASGMARLGYIRGERNCEISAAGTCRYPSAGTDTAGQVFSSKSLRQRASALGDVVHSSPFFVGPPATPYPDSIEPTAPYSTFAIANNTRSGMTYFGANDGMLHALDVNGAEVFAYIPASLFSTTAGEGLHYLSDPTYVHRYYVDLSPTVQDAYIDVGGAKAWRSVLVGALRGGGKGLFAIDVTNPTALANGAAGNILWEFTNNDLGYTFSDIRIGKMNNGKWAAVFGNGYNNDPNGDGRAKLFILYLDGSNSGSPIIIDTGAGSLDAISKDCGNANSDCNGLATPKLVDLNGNGTIDRIYAGDLFGNLWAFNVSDKTNTANWVSAYDPAPLFQACSATPCNSGNRQPIMVEPDVKLHPTQSSNSTAPNLLVFFGTGQYLIQSDNANKQQQSFYGVWDSNTGNLDRTSLVSQAITTTFDAALGNVRTITENPVAYSGNVKGWLIDFPTVGAALTGERSVTDPLAFGSTVLFNTVIPMSSNSNMCSVGGSGWRMAVDLLTGGAPVFVPIDVDNNGVFDSNDKLNGTIVVGTESGGVPAGSRLISNKRLTADSTGAITIENVQPGLLRPAARMSWSELDAP
ncbi:MAG: PilC/PilY family type IV pilus protein [Gammaproteobacteria bacterium]|nr:MAG: PilC/PilY family type IV pilus protein [Gammaproteobacteria bacterium]